MTNFFFPFTRRAASLSLIILFQILSLQLTAATELAAIFSNHMVLQRNTDVNIWGSDLPGQPRAGGGDAR